MPKDTQTLYKQTSLFTEDIATSLPVDSPARDFHSQGNVKGGKMKDTSGLTCLRRFDKLPRATLWQKMLADSLLRKTDWHSSRCVLTWKLKGTKFKRLLFQLVPSTLPIEETEFGLLPTPAASDTNTGQPGNTSMENGRYIRTSQTTGTKFGSRLTDIAVLLPTPTVDQRDRTEIVLALMEKGDPLYKRRNKEGSARQFSIKDALIFHGMLPTPRASEYKGTGPLGSKSQAHMLEKGYLEATIQETTGQSGQLSHRFTAEMMGYPKGWCDLAPETLVDLMKPKRKPKTEMKP